jgi:hypothetical protein
MYLGEPVAQIYLVDNGILVVTVDKDGRDKARKKAQEKSGNKGGCCPTSMEDYASFEKKLVFSKVTDVTKFLVKELPTLAGGMKGKEAFDHAFNEKED